MDMKKLLTYIVIIFAFSTVFIGCNSSKKCGCPTFGKNELPINKMVCGTTKISKMNQ